MDNNNKFFRADLTGNYVLNVRQEDDDNTILSKYCDAISDINCGVNMKNINVISYFRKNSTQIVLVINGQIDFPNESFPDIGVCNSFLENHDFCDLHNVEWDFLDLSE